MDHHHHHEEVTLPLRLAAEPYAKKSLSSSCVALSVHKDLTILLDDRGILGLASETLIKRSDLFPLLLPEVQPHFQSTSILILIRDSPTRNTCQWHVLAESQEEPSKIDETSVPKYTTQLVESVQHSTACAKWITTAIRKYYAQQILEPSVRGFLSILEKQFSQANLYLFELLQNALDDGATQVTFAASNGSLSMTHNGRQFTPLDVLGLSSVGLSTKSQQGKRTVGFMGVGFKAVYKRYAKVTIDDGQYAFSYQEPPKNQHGYGWVMLPLWQPPQHTQSQGCRFVLQHPRGGFNAILKDLAVLPKTAPPLLGRAALLKQESASEWTLDWNGTVHTVKRTQLHRYKNTSDMSEVVTVKITKPDGTTRTNAWLFVTHEYTPSRDAIESYQRHTKRSHTGKEQVCGFIPLTSSTTIASNFSGVVHSVLPTKIKLPIPCHLQGSFLLSVDRQQVQDLSDNAWNLNILLKLPHVLAIVFRWAAQKGVTDYTGIAKLLPLPAAGANNSNALSTQILNQTISLQPLKNALYNDPTLPVALPGSAKDDSDAIQLDKGGNENNGTEIDTGYYEGSKSVWVPPSFHQLLNPNFLRGWLGKRPVRTDAFGKEGAYHPLFLHVSAQMESVVPNRSRQLGEELQLSKRGVTTTAVELLLRTMAAIGGATKEAEAVAATKEAGKDAATSNVPGPKLPSQSNVWPLFLNEEGTLSTIDQVILHAEDMASVPPDLIPLLRPYFVKNEVINAPQPKGGRPQKKRRLNQRKILRRLHPQLERAVCDMEAGRTLEGISMGTGASDIASALSSFLQQVRLENPKQVVDVGTAVSRLLESYSTMRALSEDQLATVVKLTQYALETSNHKMLAFVMIESQGATRVVAASKAYVGKQFDDAGLGADLESFAGSRLNFLSSAYSKALPTKSLQRKFIDLIASAGVQTGLAVTISAILDIEREKKLLADVVLPKLPGKKLPQLRNKATKCDVKLPYDLGTVMNRRKCSLLDAELAVEWEVLVDRMSPECAQGFISLLLAMPVEDSIEVTKKSVAAAAACLLGQPDTNQGTSTGTMSGNRCSTRIPATAAVPLRRRLYFLPPGQPGAKALDISAARIIKQLTALKWLPCSMQSDPDGSLVLLRPEEALLETDSSRPEMPVVSLPPTVKRRLQVSPLVKALTFGTRAPPPPVDELNVLAREVGQLLGASDVDRTRVASLATKMVSLWSSIARAHLRDGLSPSDMSKLRALCKNGHCIPVRRILDCPLESTWIVQRYRCVRLSEASGASTNGSKEDLRYLTINALVAADFICDFHHSRHNPFFSYPDISAAMQKLCGIPDVAHVETESLVRASGLFVRYCCTAEPVIPNRLSPLRESFSYAMKWYIRSPRELSKLTGGVKVWVRSGPGVGSKALRRRWVSLGDKEVQPVLDDSRIRSALLSPEMGIQLLGVLNHTESERECPNSRILAKIDNEVIQHLGIWKLSDKRFTVKTKAKGAGQPVESVSSRLQLVCALLGSIVMEQGSYGEAPREQSATKGNTFLSVTYEPPLMIRHESLSREFKGPGMDTPLATPMYAVFGRAPKFTKDRCILVAGSPDDYSMELEEVILNYIGARAGGAYNQSKRWKAAIRILGHLENESSFQKFVKRDFDCDDVTQAWRALVERRSVLEKLRRAEAAKDAADLRDTLILAEEACDDDPDGGNALLRSARDLLQRLEEEEEEERLKERTRALEELKEAVQQDDPNKLRITLLLAEKACKGDANSSEDTGILNQARQRLLYVEKEIQDVPEEEPTQTASDISSMQQQIPGGGRGRGRTLPAWMTEGPKSVTGDVQSVKLEEPTTTAADSTCAMVEEQDSGTGRGRGRTLPAWITKGGDGPTSVAIKMKVEPDNGPETVKEEQQGSAGGVGTTRDNFLPSFDQPSSGFPTEAIGNGMGRGRGRTLPAWMTSSGGDGPKPENCLDDSKPLANDPILENPDGAARIAEAKSMLSAIINSENIEENGTTSISEAVDARGAPTRSNAVNGDSLIASGRGRGVSRTLPAWMTADGPKRVRSPSVDGSDDHNNSKRIRTEGGFKYSIRVVLDKDKEPDFARWLESTVQKEATSRGGSAIFEQQSQFED